MITGENAEQADPKTTTKALADYARHFKFPEGITPSLEECEETIAGVVGFTKWMECGDPTNNFPHVLVAYHAGNMKDKKL